MLTSISKDYSYTAKPDVRLVLPHVVRNNLSHTLLKNVSMEAMLTLSFSRYLDVWR